VSGNTLYIFGGSEVNQIDVTGQSPPYLDVQDNAGVLAGQGCFDDPQTSNVVDCGTDGTVNIVASLGGGDDTFSDNCIWCSASTFTWDHPIDSIAVYTGPGNNAIHFQQTGSGTGIKEHLIQAGDGNNTITLTDAKNVIEVGDGNNTINLSNGTNQVVLGNGTNTVNGLDGIDTIKGGSGHNQINESSFCGPNVCGLGSLSFYGVDGGVDVVTCGLGTNLLYIDQFDRVGSECNNVHQVTVGTGRATAKPHAVSYSSPAKPLANHTYHSKTSQGQAFTLQVINHGRYFTMSHATIRFLCPGGDGQHANTATDYINVTPGEHQKISKNGSFNTEFDFTPGGGSTDEVVYLVGAFNGKKAKGVIVGNVQIAGRGECTTGRVTWSTTG
jgi:hypothetical protein